MRLSMRDDSTDTIRPTELFFARDEEALRRRRL